jgi:hypothetical protein
MNYAVLVYGPVKLLKTINIEQFNLEIKYSQIYIATYGPFLSNG